MVAGFDIYRGSMTMIPSCRPKPVEWLQLVLLRIERRIRLCMLCRLFQNYCLFYLQLLTCLFGFFYLLKTCTSCFSKKKKKFIFINILGSVHRGFATFHLFRQILG